jgi:hypothetical protein
MRTVFFLPILFFLLLTGCGGGSCTSLDCKTSTYNLLVADVDFTATNPKATNIEVIATSSWQDMTHPRVSPDRNWVAFTTYNDPNSDGCATTDQGYVDTGIKAVSMDGSQTKSIIGATAGVLNSNSYWYGSSFEFTFLSGAPGSTRVYRAQTDSSMNLIAGPTAVTTGAGILPVDPMALSNSQLVYPGLFDSGGTCGEPGSSGTAGVAAAIWLQTLSPAGTPTAISLGRDSAGNILCVPDIQENDPKISPDGSQVAFMRRAKNSGSNGFGWRIFVVPVASPQTETNISSSLGSSLIANDGLPEWVDNSTLVFSHIEADTNTRTLWTMKDDGSGRKQVSLPPGFRYSDVFPFVDGASQQKIVISAQKVGAACTMP